MLSLLLCAVFLALTIWGLFSPEIASWVFVTASLMYTGWVFLGNAALKNRRLRGLEYERFDSLQLVMLRKHPLYFYHPFLAQNYASV